MTGLFGRLGHRSTAQDLRVLPRVAARFEESSLDVTQGSDLEDLADDPAIEGQHMRADNPGDHSVARDLLEVAAHVGSGRASTSGEDEVSRLASSTGRADGTTPVVPASERLEPQIEAEAGSPSLSAPTTWLEQAGGAPFAALPGSDPDGLQPTLGQAALARSGDPSVRSDRARPPASERGESAAAVGGSPTLPVGAPPFDAGHENGGQFGGGDRPLLANSVNGWAVEPAGVDVSAIGRAEVTRTGGSAQPSSVPTTEVTIGRIHVVTSAPTPAPQRPRPRRAAPRVELDSYLRGRW